MKFAAWIERQGLSYTEVAQLIGVANSSVAYRYVRRGRVPSRSQMMRIYLATDGQVAPNDFYDLPEMQSPPPRTDEQQAAA